jgi:hypothetical protein
MAKAAIAQVLEKYANPNTLLLFVEREFESAVAQQARGFERLGGRPPRGVPILVPIILRAVDHESMTAAINYAVSIEVQKDQFLEAARDRAKELETKTVSPRDRNDRTR